MRLTVSLILTYQHSFPAEEAHEAIHAAADAFADAFAESLEESTGHTFGVHSVVCKLDRSRRTYDGARPDGNEGTYTVTVAIHVPRRAQEAFRHTAGVMALVRTKAVDLLDYLCEQAEHGGGGCTTYPATTTVCVA